MNRGKGILLRGRRLDYKLGACWPHGTGKPAETWLPDVPWNEG
jgi:hypothetical protein